MPVAVAHPVRVYANPLWDKTSSAHAQTVARPLCAVLGAIVVVVVWRRRAGAGRSGIVRLTLGEEHRGRDRRRERDRAPELIDAATDD